MLNLDLNDNAGGRGAGGDDDGFADLDLDGGAGGFVLTVSVPDPLQTGTTYLVGGVVSRTGSTAESLAVVRSLVLVTIIAVQLQQVS